jgi:hypothetical protein
MSVINSVAVSNEKKLDAVVRDIVNAFSAVLRNGHGHVLIVVKRWDKKRCQVIVSKGFSKSSLIEEIEGGESTEIAEIEGGESTETILS